MKKITLFLTSLFVSITMFSQTQMSGEYTVGTGGTYDYASMADAGMAIKAAEFIGDVTLLICTDLTETINTGIVNKSEYTLTIRPDKDENRTITYTTATDNTGPTAVFVIGGDMTKTPGSTIGWASIPTKNVVVDGAAQGKTTPRLKITTGKWGTSFLLYGDVQDCVVKNCILENTAAADANYALTFRSEKYSSTSKDIGPKNCLVENCVLEATHATKSQAVYFQGNQANSAAGYPADITIRNCNIKAHARGMYVRQVKNLTVEGCTFDMSDMASGLLCHGILGEKVVGTAIVRGNKFVKNSTKNHYGGGYGLQTITASGGADVWVIENNYFAGYDALSSITNTTYGTEGRLVAVRCGDSCVVRHNTFHMPKLTKTPASALVGSQPTALLWLAGSKQYPVQNNIFICEEETANVSLIRGGLNPNVTGNVFFHNGGNAAIVAAAPSCMTFADLETSYPTQAATSKWANVTFADAANGDLSLAGSSDGDLNLAVDRLAEVLTDINGTARREKTYAGAYEGSEFPAEVCSVTTTVVPVDGGTVAGGGDYAKGASVTLTATSNDHYDFVNWTGDITSTDNPLTITVNSDMTITANFQEHAKYIITASAADNTMGYVTGGGTYYVGETVTLKATAKTGYYFTGWSDSNTDNPRTITVAEDVTLQANFAVAHPRVYAYALDVTDNGDSYTFSFKPNTDAVSGNLLLYNEDRTDVEQTHAITSSLVAHTAATITLNKSDLPNQTNIPWAIELSGNAIPVFAETFADADYRFAKGHATVDNSPESEYFGRVYVADRRSTKANSGLYVYNPDFTQVNADAYKLGMATAGYSRPAVGADGTVYLTGYTDAESGIFVVNPADLTTCTQFYNGTRAGSGLFTNGSAELGSSTSGVSVYGEGKDAVLYSMMEDGTDANANSGKQPIVKYQIGQEDGSVLKQWSTAPTWHINYPATGKDTYNYGNNAFAATEKGVWISQNKSNDADRPEIAFIDKDGEIQFMQNLNKSQGAGLAVNADNTTLYLQKAGEILEYTISWTGNKPALTLAKTYPVSLPYITTLSLDYAGNLIACAGTQYGSNTNNNVMKLVCYTLPTDNNTCITPAPKAQVITKPSNPTLLDNTVVAPQVQKIVRDGQVLIIRDGKTFNMMGQEVR